ncbi:L-seryl-tRNA(Sec) selenium transferase [Desulforamulus hydrothermalis]|uniref:L-seryl-tRNA(Sec) selenium transferase n=1 Tax=Desulforamulus hydrothermalis Lam5 = DSM 18033 TaxID=1121428 RepID=K8E688_9FIRM|nr:L-seryl-tRNA(Sec) selenium transferase [Desulforamulus hydrothermalis]CCO06968.1 L-seryl-tRNA(Sec) selenium transferase [Desulforamulus hydrothermalis Lam5 = DSM 18033]SHG98584.1 L-seryl-tRNA(Sec) selenium transferase [Desulforamulus hydrothermalis Lam5 = DSM 18033]
MGPAIDKTLLRALPKIDEVMKQHQVNRLLEMHPRSIVVDGIREAVELIRQDILKGSFNSDPANLFDLVIERALKQVAAATRPNLRRVINGTGVVLHTNLGRALLSEAARQAVDAVAAVYCNLEFNLATGKRGSRYEPLEELLVRLTGAEAALVVNNNAAAVLLALGTLARGKEVIVSRGQLVEIGGSFRIPDVMEQSGASLVEVGTTNKTHPRDYRNSISENTALLLHVHTSNYRIVGFTRETTVAELVEIGREYNLPVMSDLGSGFLVDLAKYGLPVEPSVQDTVAAGADVVTFSGDKLLGGPQAGIIVGKRKHIEKMKQNPLTRAVRINKFTVAALEATLRDYLDAERVLEKIPTLKMLTEPVQTIYERAEALVNGLRPKLTTRVELKIMQGYSQVGGGSMPTAELPTYLMSCLPARMSADELAQRLRQTDPAVVGRLQDGCFLVDLRTVQPDEIDLLAAVMADILNSAGG